MLIIGITLHLIETETFC